jgi:hypothetical protein
VLFPHRSLMMEGGRVILFSAVFKLHAEAHGKIWLTRFLGRPPAYEEDLLEEGISLSLSSSPPTTKKIDNVLKELRMIGVYKHPNHHPQCLTRNQGTALKIHREIRMT